MPIRSDDPLRRCTLNLYEADCAAMELAFGHGWTTQVREWIHEKAYSIRKYERRTLGDLTDE